MVGTSNESVPLRHGHSSHFQWVKVWLALRDAEDHPTGTRKSCGTKLVPPGEQKTMAPLSSSPFGCNHSKEVYQIHQWG